MKGRFLTKIISGFLIAAFVFCCAAPASAAVASPGITRYVGSSVDYPDGIYAYMITTFFVDRKYPIITTQTEHISGIETSISTTIQADVTVSASASLEVAASAEIELGIRQVANAALAGSMAAELGVGASCTLSTGTTVTYTIPEDYPADYYRMVIVFPGRRVMQRLYGVNSAGTQITLWSQNVQYVPCSSGPYYSVESFDPYA